MLVRFSLINLLLFNILPPNPYKSFTILATVGIPGTSAATFVAAPTTGIAASTPNPRVAPSTPILNLFFKTLSASSPAESPMSFSVTKVLGRTSKASDKVLVPSGATMPSAAPPAKLVVKACLNLVSVSCLP